MSRATRPRPMMASMKLNQVRAVPSGLEKPRVVREEPLSSKEWAMLPDPMPQKMKVKATATDNIHTRGRVTKATGVLERAEMNLAARAPPAVDQDSIGKGEHGGRCG